MVRLSAFRTGRHYPSKYSWYSLLLEDESTLGPKCGRKNYVNDSIGNRIRDLLAFRVVSQPTTPLRAPGDTVITAQFNWTYWRPRAAPKPAGSCEEGRVICLLPTHSWFYRQPALSAGTNLTELPIFGIIYTEIGKQCQNIKFSIKNTARLKSASLSFPKGFYATKADGI